MKKCAIHQPNFLPWEGYFHKMNEVDCFVILDNVDIVLGTNKAITNRTKIKTPAGEHWISIPIKKKALCYLVFILLNVQLDSSLFHFYLQNSVNFLIKKH